LLAFHLIKLGLLIQRDEDGYNMSHEWARLNAYKILIKKPKTWRQLWEYRRVRDSKIKTCFI